MLDYLGFPHQQEDVTKFISAVDKAEPDGAADGKISPEEFLQVVGKFGGCCKLFETRGWPRSELPSTCSEVESRSRHAGLISTREVTTFAPEIT